VLSYFWELPVRKFSGFAGKVLDNWAISQITTFQSGFPIHIESFDDTELTASVAGFASAGEPDLIAPFRKLDPHKTANNLGFDPNSFTTNGTDNVNSPSCSTQVVFGCFRQSLLGRFGNSPRTICCGSRTSNTDFSVHKNIAVTERTRFELRAEFFNIFNHTQFFNPDGSTTDGSDFGRVKRAREPRLVQFALKYFF
jgi:hypothetical protein